MSVEQPCPRPGCDGIIRDWRRATGRNEMAGEWIVGRCSNDCGALSLDLAPSPPPPRATAAPVVVEWSGDLSDIRSVPSAWFAPRLCGHEVERGLMMRCPFHDDNRASLSVQDNDAGWRCHGCGARGGLPEFFCGLQGRSVPSDRREFKKLIFEIVDALRRSP